MHALSFPCSYKNTCHFIRKLHITVSKQQNTMIELLKTSTGPQISKGVDALKQLFLRKKDTVPLKDKAKHLKKSTCYNLSKLHGTFNYELPS